MGVTHIADTAYDGKRQSQIAFALNDSYSFESIHGTDKAPHSFDRRRDVRSPGRIGKNDKFTFASEPIARQRLDRTPGVVWSRIDKQGNGCVFAHRLANTAPSLLFSDLNRQGDAKCIFAIPMPE